MLTIDLLGSNEFCLPTAELLLANGYTLRCVTTRPPKTHQSRNEPVSALATFARAHQLPLNEVRTKHELEVLYTSEWSVPDALVVASFGIIIPNSLLALPAFGALNIHPSLLPQFRGPSPIQTAILNNEHTTGVSIILLDAQMDHGPILAQESSIIAPNETSETLKTRLAQQGAQVLQTILPQWFKKELIPHPQDDTLATFTKKIEKEDGRIDWTAPASTIERTSRAYTPWPGAWSTLVPSAGQTPELIKLYDASIVNERVDNKKTPGSILGVTSSGELIVQTGSATVTSFGSIQRPGRKKMSITAFVQGYPQITSSVFV